MIKNSIKKSNFAIIPSLAFLLKMVLLERTNKFLMEE